MFPLTVSRGVLNVGAVFNNETHEMRNLYRTPGASAPMQIDFEHVTCAYWENTLDLFCFACDVLNWDYENTAWIDSETLECLDYWQLCDIAFDDMED